MKQFTNSTDSVCGISETLSVELQEFRQRTPRMPIGPTLSDQFPFQVFLGLRPEPRRSVNRK